MRALKKLWQAVRSVLLVIGRAMGRINAFVLLSFSFYLILFPLGLLRRLFGKKSAAAGWLPREPLEPDHFKKQY